MWFNQITIWICPSLLLTVAMQAAIITTCQWDAMQYCWPLSTCRNNNAVNTNLTRATNIQCCEAKIQNTLQRQLHGSSKHTSITNCRLDSLCWFYQHLSPTPHFRGAHSGGYGPQIRTPARLLMHPSFIILRLLVQKLSYWQTNKQTHRQMPLKTSNTLHYATTLGKQLPRQYTVISAHLHTLVCTEYSTLQTWYQWQTQH